MSSKDKKITEVRIKLPNLATRIVKVTDTDVKYFGGGQMQIVSSVILNSKTNPTSMVLPDYEPNLYKQIKFTQFTTLKFEGTEEDVLSFRKKLRDFLAKNVNEDDLGSHDLEFQIDSLLILLANYKSNKSQIKYREKVRRQILEFYPQMASLLTPNYNIHDNYGVTIAFGNLVKDEYHLPAPRGNKHLIDALGKFFLNYYNNNKPVKNYDVLTNQLIYDNYKKVMDGVIKVDDELLELFHFDFHFNLLAKIRTFDKQFPKPQRKSAFNLTVKEQTFIVNFIQLIDYEKWEKNSYKFVSPNFIEVPLRSLNSYKSKLRLKMEKYRALYKNSTFYTI